MDSSRSLLGLKDVGAAISIDKLFKFYKTPISKSSTMLVPLWCCMGIKNILNCTISHKIRTVIKISEKLEKNHTMFDTISFNFGSGKAHKVDRDRDPDLTRTVA
uniref:Uncharacterized protein n=1 Tax=Romanomermis culicivorax TaxID=13658 RepID=A0A915ICV1_ROMCU